MRKFLLVSASIATLAVAAPAGAAGVLFALPPVSGSTETIAFGISNNGNITGFWLDSSSVEHGFVGPDDGSNYTTFDDTNDGSGTQARGINNHGTIMGIANVGTGTATDYVPFERNVGGTITAVTKKGQVLNYLVQGITKSGIFDGNYENANGQYIAYTGTGAKYQSKITLTGITTTGVAARGIDNAGDTVGWYLDTSGVQHGYYQPASGNAVTIDNPNGVTSPEGINNKGEISGLYTDSNNNRHGFTYKIATAKFKELTVPNSTFVEVWGLNDQGQVAIDGQDSSSGLFVGYIYCPSATNCPGAAAKQQRPVLRRPSAPVPRQMP